MYVSRIEPQLLVYQLVFEIDEEGHWKEKGERYVIYKIW